MSNESRMPVWRAPILLTPAEAEELRAWMDDPNTPIAPPSRRVSIVDAADVFERWGYE